MLPFRRATTSSTVGSSGGSISPVKSLEHRHVSPPYYEDTKGKTFGSLQGFVIVPDTDQLLTDVPHAREVSRKQLSNGCQSPCGNLWLAAIAFLFEDRETVKKVIKSAKGKAPGNVTQKKNPTKNRYQSKVFLAEFAARALAKTFLTESNLDESAREYEEFIVRALWGDKCYFWLLFCPFDDIPERVRRWLYVLEFNTIIQQIQQRALDSALLNYKVDDFEPGKIYLEDDQGYRMTILSLAAMSPNSGSRGRFRVDRQYERVLGLVHTKKTEVVEGALVLGERTGWIGTEESTTVFVTDEEGSGRWYRLIVERQKDYAVVAGQHDDAFAQLVSGSPSPDIMALKFHRPIKSRATRVYKGSPERLSGIYMMGHWIDGKRILIGFSPRMEGGIQRQRVIVSDPSSIPTDMKNEPLYKRVAPRNPLSRSTLMRILCGGLIGHAVLGTIVASMTCGGTKADDELLLICILRLVFDWIMRFAIFGTCLRQRSMGLGEATVKLLFARSIDLLMMGVPWGKRNFNDRSSLRYLFWWRRSSLRARALLAVGFISWSIYGVLKENEENGTQTFFLGLFLGPSLVLGEGSLGTFLDELSGEQLSSEDMVRYLASCCALDIIATVLVTVVFYPSDDGRNTVENVLFVFLLLETLFYTVSLLRCQAVLRAGLEEEKHARDELASESNARFGTLIYRIHGSATDWGLGGIANRSDVRGLLTLFEERTGGSNRTHLLASSPLIRLSDWVVATQAGGFKLSPVIHGDGLVYEARDFPSKLERIKQVSYYGNIKLLYVKMDVVWTGSRFPHFDIPGTGKSHRQRIDGFQNSHGHADYVQAYNDDNRAPRQAAVMFGEGFFVPLESPLSDSS